MGNDIILFKELLGLVNKSDDLNEYDNTDDNFVNFMITNQKELQKIFKKYESE